MEKNITLTHREKRSILTVFFGYFILAGVLAILIPAGALIITKDAKPGDGLYPYKIQIENSALFLVKGTSFEEPLLKLILGRRIEERKR